MKIKRALLVVDIQNDFCPGGALGVPEGDKIIPALNKYIRIFSRKKLPIFISRDWHPVRTGHFQDFGGAWPVHCIHNSKGAQFHPRFKFPGKEAILLYKGMDPDKDSYSVFHAEDERGVSFENLLRISGVKELYIGGLATDYCVRFTVRDALKKGFGVKLLTDAIKGVNLKPRDSEETIKEMLNAGAKKTNLKEEG